MYGDTYETKQAVLARNIINNNLLHGHNNVNACMDAWRSGELQKDVKEAFDEVHCIYVQLRRPKI